VPLGVIDPRCVAGLRILRCAGSAARIHCPSSSHESKQNRARPSAMPILGCSAPRHHRGRDLALQRQLVVS
jgi:hypothetical protein